MAPDTLERRSPAQGSGAAPPAVLRRRPWIDADAGATHAVANPRPAARSAPRPVMGAAETRRAIEAAERAWPAWRDKTAKERSAILRKWFELMIANVDDLALILTTEQGKPLAEAKGEVAYRRLVRRVVRRGGAARLRRRDPDHRQRPAPGRDQAAGRRLRGDHAVELPVVDDHAQGRAGARRRLHRRHQAGRSDAVLGAGAGRARAARRLSARRAQRRHRQALPRSAASCARTRWCASSRSPARPRSAAC